MLLSSFLDSFSRFPFCRLVRLSVCLQCELDCYDFIFPASMHACLSLFVSLLAFVFTYFMLYDMKLHRSPLLLTQMVKITNEYIGMTCINTCTLMYLFWEIFWKLSFAICILIICISLLHTYACERASLI